MKLKEFIKILNSSTKEDLLERTDIIELSLDDLYKIIDGQNFYNRALGELIHVVSGEAFVFDKDDTINKIYAFPSNMENPWIDLKRKVDLHNKIFPETSYFISYSIKMPELTEEGREKLQDLLSDGEIDELFDNDYLPCVSQEKIISKEEPSTNQLKLFMMDRGFEPIGRTEYKKGPITVKDIKPANARIQDGKILIFDPDISID
jgi:hypothetical protein